MSITSDHFFSLMQKMSHHRQHHGPNNSRTLLSSMRQECWSLIKRKKVHTLTKLEILENFDARLCDTCDLLHLTKLQILTGWCVRGRNVDLRNFMTCLNYNRLSLHHSSLVVKQLLGCDALGGLSIEGRLGMKALGVEGIGWKFTSLMDRNLKKTRCHYWGSLLTSVTWSCAMMHSSGPIWRVLQASLDSRL